MFQFPSAPLFPRFKGALVRKAANQSGADYTAPTAIAWDQESRDIGGWHDNVTNNSRLTVINGVVRVRCAATVTLSALTTTDVVTLDLRKNGSNIFDGYCGDRLVTGSGAPILSFASGVLDAVAGDYFEAFLDTTADASIDILAAFSSFGIEAVWG